MSTAHPCTAYAVTASIDTAHACCFRRDDNSRISVPFPSGGSSHSGTAHSFLGISRRFLFVRPGSSGRLPLDLRCALMRSAARCCYRPSMSQDGGCRGVPCTTCPEINTEYFVPGTEPKKRCNPAWFNPDASSSPAPLSSQPPAR